MINDYLYSKYRGGLDFILYLLACKGFIISANDRKLASFKDKHMGQRCFVIGNGPSLKIEDLNKLKHEITFGSNKIYLAFNQTDWRPTYYAAEDRLFLESNFETVNHLCEFTKFIPVRHYRNFPKIKDGIYFRRIVDEDFYPNEPGFGLNPLIHLFWGHTITYTLIQLACYMGIREIYLIGVDMNYRVEKGKETGLEPYLATNIDNYFHPDYLQTGDKARRPNLHMHLKSYEKANKVLSELGGHIYNATRGGNLEVFPRVDFNTLFS